MYHYLSSACPCFGMVWVHNMSITCPIACTGFGYVVSALVKINQKTSNGKLGFW